MNHPSDSSNIDRILDAERAQAPRWRAALRPRAPSWFRGQELDLVDDVERVQLYEQTRARFGRLRAWAAAMVPLCTLPHVAANIRSGEQRGLWIAVAVGYAVMITAAVVLRRRNILQTARRSLRERADWPPRAERERG